MTAFHTKTLKPLGFSFEGLIEIPKPEQSTNILGCQRHRRRLQSETSPGSGRSCGRRPLGLKFRGLGLLGLK